MHILLGLLVGVTTPIVAGKIKKAKEINIMITLMIYNIIGLIVGWLIIG